MQSICRSKAVDFSEVIITDHRGFIFNLDVKKYFNLKASKYDEITKKTFNLNN